MHRRTILATALAAALSSTPVAAAQPQGLPARTAPATTLGPAAPVRAWTELCGRQPGECAVEPRDRMTVSLDRRTWDLLLRVNGRVNRAIVPQTDMDHWGVADRWDLAEDGHGDCEDYALRKRAELAEAGIPRRAMRMTVVIDERREGHAVLTVLTDGGDIVLDNRTDLVLPWQRTSYTYVKRESQDASATGWVYLGGARAPDLTASAPGRDR